MNFSVPSSRTKPRALLYFFVEYILLKSFFVRIWNYLHFVKIQKFDDKKKRRISLFLFFWQFFPSTILPTSDDILTFNILLLLFLMERRKPPTKTSTGTMLLQHHKQCRRLVLIITLQHCGPSFSLTGYMDALLDTILKKKNHGYFLFDG